MLRVFRLWGIVVGAGRCGGAVVLQATFPKFWTRPRQALTMRALFCTCVLLQRGDAHGVA